VPAKNPVVHVTRNYFGDLSATSQPDYFALRAVSRASNRQMLEAS